MGAGASTPHNSAEEALAAGKTQEQINAFIAKQSPALTTSKPAGEVKKGNIVMPKGYPRRVFQMPISSGATKGSMTGIDIFTGTKCMESVLPSQIMAMPIVIVSQYMVTGLLWHNPETGADADEGWCSLKDDDGNTRNVKCPGSMSPDPKLGDQIRGGMAANKDVTVTVTSAMGQSFITSCKVGDGE